MKKLLVIGSILFLVLLFFISLWWDSSRREQESLRMTVSLGSYSRYGAYKIDPETILVSLEHENTNVFEPLLEDPRDVEELTDISISWTQADYLRIFSALSKLVWDDGMDPQVWSISDIDFSGGCIDEGCDPFHYARMVYFKKVGLSYTTRFMDIQPYFGLVRWGDGANYLQPIWRKWKGIEFARAKVTAEDALRIAEENGGRKKRLSASGNRCPVEVYSSRSDPENWNVWCAPHLYKFLIDLNTGEFKISER